MDRIVLLIMNTQPNTRKVEYHEDTLCTSAVAVFMTSYISILASGFSNDISVSRLSLFI